MALSTIARFMQMSGAITGQRDGVHWLRLPRRPPPSDGNIFGYRFIGRSGLRIASTVVSSKRAGSPSASAGVGG